ncbi:hypothetical protein KKA02_03475 [Patescibacteria group bacterium]|nr:hypothetical protein [Patescibacteria group bacterium]
MSFFLDFLFPSRCYSCQKIGQYICPKCRVKLINKGIDPFLSKKLEASLSLFKYHPPLIKVLQDLKYHFITRLADELVEIAVKEIETRYPSLLKYWQANNYLLIPIPLHQKRLNWRGFNQSALLAKKLAYNLKLQYSDQILFRLKYTQPQAKIKNKSFRATNISNSFSVSTLVTPPWRGPVGNVKITFSQFTNIILFDDIITTGSTIKSAVDTLTKHNFKSIWALSLAG